MQIPESVKIGGLTYSVEIVDEIEEGCVGKIYYKELRIKIVKAKPEFMLLTFWHEILHAMNSEIAEIQIEYMAQSMMQLLLDNPKIYIERKAGEIKYVSKKEKSKLVSK